MGDLMELLEGRYSFLPLVAVNFGQRGESRADVNGDGVVNITDLVLVAGALGNHAAAP